MLDWFLPSIFLGAAQRRWAARGVPVFAWHRLSSPPAAAADPFLYASPAAFAGQLTALCQAGLTSLGLAEAVRTRPVGGRVALTFDDGFADVVENGLPLLHQHGFQATEFLVADRLGGYNEWDVAKGDVAAPLMDEAQVRTWLAAGMTIGSHSLTHPNLRRLKPDAAREEIQASKHSLEDRFGVAVDWFCYPYGAWNEPVRDLVREAGYLGACTLQFGVIQPSTPALDLPRIYPLSTRELLAKVRDRIGRKLKRR